MTGDHLSRKHADVALIHAAIEAMRENSASRKRSSSPLRSGAAAGSSEIGRTMNCATVASRTRSKCTAWARKIRLEAEGVETDAQLDRLGAFENWLTVFGRRFQVVSTAGVGNCRIEVDGVSHVVDRDDGGIVRAPSPGVVVAGKPGDVVSAGQTVAVLESMKMETRVPAPFAGIVRQVLSIPHVQVGAGTPLVQIDPMEDRSELPQGERIQFSTQTDPSAVHDPINALQELRQVL